MQPRIAASALALAITLAAAGCSAVGSTGDGGGQESSSTVVLVTHDSFAVSKQVLADFEQQSGLSVQVRATGDAGALVNQLVLTKDAPLGDAAYGIDNAFASRALEADVLEPYSSPAARDVVAGLHIDDTARLTPVDYGDVCINVDRRWFAERDLPEPRTLQDLTDPAYEDLLVVSDPSTSSPGLAFLLATVDAFGEDGWRDYWTALRDNGVKVSSSWSDAYFVDFSGSSGRGPRPLVLSYASSPPAEATAGERRAPTRALLDTCFRQVEYAGVLAGAENPDGARELIDFLSSTSFQEDLPEKMYVYPTDPQAQLPPDWVRFAPLAKDPYTMDPASIDANREQLIEQWTDLVVG
jgi:thiamine transport system substrate-binding protein